MSEDVNTFDLRLREASEPLHRSHLRQPPTWIEFMREIAPQWQRYMREHDTPEQRLATKLSPSLHLRLLISVSG